MSTSSDRSAEESARIERVYRERSGAGKGQLYGPGRPEIKLERDALDTAIRDVLADVAHGHLVDLRFLDVGCGSGTHLRKLIQWGATPEHLTGTELLTDRLDSASNLTGDGPHWYLGPLEGLPDERPFDVISAFTVFSSILDVQLRRELATEMWNRTAPGGVVLIYDFRYNNPANAQVRKITKNEIATLFPDGAQTYRTLTLIPPFARRIAPLSTTTAVLLGRIPALRSHFLFTARKGM